MEKKRNSVYVTNGHDAMEVNYGICAIATEPNGDGMIEVIHFAGYSREPTAIDYQMLEKELKEDEEFGIGDKPFYLIPASPALVERFRTMSGRIDGLDVGHA